MKGRSEEGPQSIGGRIGVDRSRSESIGVDRSRSEEGSEPASTLHVPEGTTDHHNGDTLNELIGPQQTKEMIYHDVPHEIGVAIHPKRPAGTANDQNKKQ